MGATRSVEHDRVTVPPFGTNLMRCRSPRYWPPWPCWFVSCSGAG